MVIKTYRCKCGNEIETLYRSSERVRKRIYRACERCSGDLVLVTFDVKKNGQRWRHND